MPNDHHIDRHIDRMFEDCTLVELAARREGQWWRGGIFDDPGKFKRVVADIGDTADVYTSVNRPAPRKRIHNHLVRGKGLKNDDMAQRTRLIIDFDPVRAAGFQKHNASHAEMHAAVQVALRMIEDFTQRAGWAQPAFVYSGNGAHLVWRARIPIDQDTDKLVKQFYAAFQPYFSTPRVDFDVAVANAGRILRLPGTWNIGKQADAVRPARQATVITPDTWDQCVTDMDLATALAKWGMLETEEKKKRDKQAAISVIGRGDYKTLDVVKWFTAHGQYKRPLGEGKHAVTCPWHTEHSTSDAPDSTGTVIWESDGGWPTFHCSHNHCAGRALADVSEVWGDGDVFCAAPYAGGRVPVCIS